MLSEEALTRETLNALLKRSWKLLNTVTKRVQKWKENGGRPSQTQAEMLIQAIFARSTRTYEAVVEHLGNRGFGEQGAMLNRTLFEDMVDARWVALNPELAAQRLSQHDRYSKALRLELAKGFPERFGDTLDGQELDPPMTQDERKELAKLFGPHCERPWTTLSTHQRFKEIESRWPTETERAQARFIFEWVQWRNNETLHPSSYSLATLGGPKLVGNELHYRLGSTEHLLRDVLFFAFWTYTQTVWLLFDTFGLAGKGDIYTAAVEPGLRAFAEAKPAQA